MRLRVFPDKFVRPAFSAFLGTVNGFYDLFHILFSEKFSRLGNGAVEREPSAQILVFCQHNDIIKHLDHTIRSVRDHDHDLPLIRYFPELEAAPGTEKQRILELLHMQTGRDDLENRYAHEGDLLADWAGMPLLWEPGAHFEYCNMSSYTLGRLVERVSGQSLLDFCRENIFAPVGIRFPQWFTDQQGHHFGHSALHLF